MDVLLKEVGQVSVFLICAQTLMHFRAKDSYEKYIRLLISMMLLLLLIQPVLDFFSIKSGGDFWSRIDVYEQRMETAMGTGVLEESEIERMLEGLVKQKVEQGISQVQESELQGENTEGATEKSEADDFMTEQIEIEEIDVGGTDGEF